MTFIKDKSKVANILTFDLEEWFHILDLPEPVRKSEWDSLPSHAEKGLNLFLDLLLENNITCTFFIVGWIAEKHPEIVRKISSFNYEIASHGYYHELIDSLRPDHFREDIGRAKKVLEDITGSEIKGYRGPGFSITHKNQWAFDIIAEEGFQYDSSLFPGHHSHGGISGLPIKPFILHTSNGQRIEEYPVTLINIANFRIAFSGGGYFRLFPGFFISACIKWLNRKNIPVLSYFHPRDLDANLPRLPMPLKRKFKCYINISRSTAKLEKILKSHTFSSISDWRKYSKNSLPLFSIR
jgi:polysaccharide deacetylase family protein (PEP-CTERM system associated)